MTAVERDWADDPAERITQLVHDLRTPLTIVQGFAELLQRGGDGLDDARRTEYLARIVQASREMKDILDAERENRLA